ncbi:MAG TPA: uroporphyrinogen-III synthase [Steroidobacteraceae bacterium]|nr:uroporphyrinogen-III synthase [Steroidobacteraceae bacterium]
MTNASLSGRTIAVPETRALDLFAAMLERRGAKVLRCPLVAIRDAADPAPVLTFLRQFAADGCDDLVLLTGEGLYRLLSCIERHEPALRAPFLAALGRVRKVTRGPKPARALRELGFASDLAAAVPTTAGVIAALDPLALAGRSVGVQLYGTDPNRPLTDFLAARGARVLAVAPYEYASGTDDEAVRTLIARMLRDEVDAIAFTSSPQVERLFAVGGAQARAALEHTHVAAVGPVVAGSLTRHGVQPRSMPADSFFLKPLTSALEAALDTPAS